jgi:4-hydroxybenzoate polyprenyltransferase
VNYLQYLKERFPPQQFLLLAGLLAAAVGACVQAPLYGRVASWPAVLAAALALLFFLFRLRLFDELKDYAHDSKYYPDRPLHRGLVTVAGIKRLIVLTLAAEVFIAARAGLAPLAFFAASLGYSLLMFKEFFAPEWLRGRFALYITTHELLAVPLFFYAAALQGPRPGLLADPGVWATALFLGCQLFFLEIARKMRPPEQENAARDTYTAQYGVRGASLLLGGTAAAALALGWFACGRGAVYALASLPFAWFLCSIISFVRRPTPASSKAVFNTAVAYFTLLSAAAIWAALA